MLASSPTHTPVPIESKTIFVTHPDHSRALGISEASDLLSIPGDDATPSLDAILCARCDHLAQLRDALLTVNESIGSEGAAAFQATEVAPATRIRWRAACIAVADGLVVAALYTVQQATPVGVDAVVTQPPSGPDIAILVAVALVSALGVCASSSRLGLPRVVSAYLVLLVISAFFTVKLVSVVAWFVYLALIARFLALLSAAQLRFVNVRIRRLVEQFALEQSARHSQRLALSAEIDALLAATRVLLHTRGGALAQQQMSGGRIDGWGGSGAAAMHEAADVVLATMLAIEETLGAERALLQQLAASASGPAVLPRGQDAAWEAFRRRHPPPALQRQRGFRLRPGAPLAVGTGAASAVTDFASFPLRPRVGRSDAPASPSGVTARHRFESQLSTTVQRDGLAGHSSQRRLERSIDGAPFVPQSVSDAAIDDEPTLLRQVIVDTGDAPGAVRTPHSPRQLAALRSGGEAPGQPDSTSSGRRAGATTGHRRQQYRRYQSRRWAQEGMDDAAAAFRASSRVQQAPFSFSDAPGTLFGAGRDARGPHVAPTAVAASAAPPRYPSTVVMFRRVSPGPPSNRAGDPSRPDLDYFLRQ